MLEKGKTLISILVLAGLGGLIRTGVMWALPQIWLVLVNYTAVFCLVYLTSSGRLSALPNWLTLGLTVGFFGGLSTIAPILVDLVAAVQAGDWLLATGLALLHIGGGVLVALWAHSRAGRERQRRRA